MTKLVDIPNTPQPVTLDGYSDEKGNLTAPTASMVSDRYGVVEGQLVRFHGDGTNLVTDTADLEAAGYTHTVTVDDATHFTATAQNQTVYDTIATTALNYYCFSFKARDMSAANTDIEVFHNDSATGNTTAITHANVYKWDSTNSIWDSDTSAGLTTTLTRYYVVVLGKTGDGNVTFGLQDGKTSAWTQIEFTELQCEDLGNLTTAPGPEMFDAETVTARASGYTSVVGAIYRIVTQNTLDYTTIGSPDNTATTVFICTSADDLGAGDALSDITSPDKGIPDKDPWPALAGAEAITDSDNRDFGDETINEWVVQADGAGTCAYDDGPVVGDFTAKIVSNPGGGGAADSSLQAKLLTGDWTCAVNTLHRIQADVRVPDTNTLKNASITPRALSGAIIAGTSITALGDNTWTTIVEYIYIAADNDGSLLIGFSGNPADDDVMYIDNISIRPVQFSWVPYGTNILQIDETEDALKITWVDNANGGIIYLRDTYDLSSDLTIGRGYTVQVDLKIAGGAESVNVRAYDGTGFQDVTPLTTSWATYTLNFVATHATGCYVNFSGMGAGEVVYIRNLSIRENTLLDSEPRTYTATSGGTATIPAEIPLTDSGIQFDGEGTNLLPYSDDFTEWTTSNITDTADEEGPDGYTNSATSLLATAANGTILYDLDPLASTDYYFTIWMKRITGTGTIALTDDNGGNYTTKTLTTSWQRFGVTRSQANPHVGIKIVTDTDKIAVFRGQVEATPYYTSSIPTNGTPVIRTTMAQDAADNGVQWTMSSALQTALSGGATAFTLIAEWTPYYGAGDTAADHGVLGIQDSADSLILIDGSDDIASNDSATEIAATAAPVSGTKHILAVSGTVSSDWDVGFSDDSGANYTWAITGTMDANGFTKDAANFFKAAFGNELPWYLGRTRIWDTAYTTDQIEAGIGDVYMGLSIRDGSVLSTGAFSQEASRTLSIRNGKMMLTRFHS